MPAISSYFACLLCGPSRWVLAIWVYTMATGGNVPDVEAEETPSEIGTDTTPRSLVSVALQAHNAAAEENVLSKKAAEKARQALKRKAEKELKLPSMEERTSQLQVALDAAKVKREVAKKEAKVESNKVRAARKRVERVKAKAKILTNNDLFEVYLMRMKDEDRRKDSAQARDAAREK